MYKSIQLTLRIINKLIICSYIYILNNNKLQVIIVIIIIKLGYAIHLLLYFNL